MTAPVTVVDNPYWDAVAGLVTNEPLWGGPVVDGYPLYAPRPIAARTELVRQYSWTITDPETVAFVAEYSRGRVVDPLAGTGYWGWLLTQLGVDVVSYDLHPPRVDAEANHWHRNTAAHSTVHRMDAVESVRLHADRALLLSWPPYDEPIGRSVLAAFPGDRVIYIGEGVGGCCGDDDLFAAFERDWVEVTDRRPVQWQGMHDYVTVYDRAGQAGAR